MSDYQRGLDKGITIGVDLERKRLDGIAKRKASDDAAHIVELYHFEGTVNGDTVDDIGCAPKGLYELLDEYLPIGGNRAFVLGEIMDAPGDLGLPEAVTDAMARIIMERHRDGIAA